MSRASHRAVYLLGPERLELREVPTPEPGPGELLLRVGAATTCGTDVKVFRRGGHPRMLRTPCPFGHEVAGEVERVGRGVASVSPGDRVVVANSSPCGECTPCRAGRENLCEDLLYLNGAFAERLLVPERFARTSVYRLPEGLAFERAAVAEPLACVLHGLEVVRPAPGSEVLVLGAGPIGLLFAGALAAQGAVAVVADPNAGRLEAARRMGARSVLGIARGGEQAETLRSASAGGRGFAAAIDATGVPEVWVDAIAAVHPGGEVCLFGGCAPGTTVPLDATRVHYGEITVRGAYHHRPATFRRALELLGAGTVDPAPLLDAERPLAGLEAGLREMMRKEALKVVVRP